MRTALPSSISGFTSPSATLGNASGLVGQNLMCHLQTSGNGFLPERVHGQRGRAVSHGLSDFRGVHGKGLFPPKIVTDADFSAINAYLKSLGGGRGGD